MKQRSLRHRLCEATVTHPCAHLSSWYITHPISSVFASLFGAELKTKAASAEKFQELEVAAEEKDREPVAGGGEGQDQDQVEGQRSRRLLRGD